VRFANNYGGARPTGAFADYFVIIAWPIAHAVLPSYLQRQLAHLLYDFRGRLLHSLLGRVAVALLQGDNVCRTRPVSVRGLTQQRRDHEGTGRCSRSRSVGRGSPCPVKGVGRDPPAMMLIGVEPHKSTATAAAVEPESNREVASIRIEATLKEYRRLLTWAHRWPERRWAIENAEGLGRHLASWLLARGEQVVDVPTTATARVRQLSRGGGRKNDRIDAAAAACVAALQGDARPLEAEGTADVLGLLDERRANLSQARVRAVKPAARPVPGVAGRRRADRVVRRRCRGTAPDGPSGG
jgi:hypothetical protein